MIRFSMRSVTPVTIGALIVPSSYAARNRVDPGHSTCDPAAAIHRQQELINILANNLKFHDWLNVADHGQQHCSARLEGSERLSCDC